MIRRALFLTVALLALASSAFCQGARLDGIATVNVFGVQHVVANATIRVCSAGSTGSPCSPLASIYSNIALNVPLANPFNADANGNYYFFASPTVAYDIQISGTGIATITQTNVTMACATGCPGLSTNNAFTGNNTHSGIETFNANAIVANAGITSGGPNTLNGGGTTAGTWTHAALHTFNAGLTSAGPNTLNGGGLFAGAFSHSGTETFTGSFLQKASPIFDIRGYGGACDNATDNTTPFHLALIDATASPGSTIFFPVGACLFNSKPDSIGNGVKLRGQGWSTNTVVGTSLIRNYVDAGTLGFITFDGNGTSARGTGSGIDDMTIGPAVGTTGGYLIKLTSTPGCVVGADCDNHRASDTKITNVFLGNGNGGTSACGLYIDGSQNTTGGSQGIRIVNVNNLRVSSTTTADCSVYANNAAHLFLNNIVIDTGFGATPGITVTGVGAAPNSAASANVYFSNLELVGDLIVDSASGVQTSGAVFVGGITTMSANTANSRLDGRFATLPASSSATSTWSSVKGAVPFVVPALAATSTGVLTGAAGEVFSITGATTGNLGMGSDHLVNFNRFNSTSVGLTNALLCVGGVTCSVGMNPGDIQSASSATAGALWLGTDALSFVARNAAGDVNVKQKLGFQAGSGFLGLFTSPLTTARTWTFPDASGTALLSGNTNTVLQTARINGCATAASLNATCDTTVTWTTAFANANYTATCTGDAVTSGVPIIEGLSISAAKTGAAITVRTLAITAAAAQFTNIDCIGIHD